MLCTKYMSKQIIKRSIIISYDYANRMIDSNGKIDTHKFKNYSLDMINNLGDAIFPDLYEKTKRKSVSKLQWKRL